ncbi:ATPase, V0 complex, subunit E1/e2 [Blastocladiella britannica]|nr:ATPase, V0 complex, subunit E1/e2 [Blastocladiella britannica]
MASVAPVFVLLLLVIALSAAVYFLYPKGPDRNLHVSSIILTAVCVYLMWGIAYLAQANPIIAPKLTIHRA